MFEFTYEFCVYCEFYTYVIVDVHGGDFGTVCSLFLLTY